MRRHPVALTLAAAITALAGLTGAQPHAAQAAPTVHTVDVRTQASLQSYAGAWEGLLVYSNTSSVTLHLNLDLEDRSNDAPLAWSVASEGQVIDAGSTTSLDVTISLPDEELLVAGTEFLFVATAGTEITVEATLTVLNQYNIVPPVSFDLDALEPVALERHWAPEPPASSIGVRPGDTVRVLADDGAFTVGPAGDWPAAQRATSITVNGAEPALPSSASVVDSAGGQLDSTVPRPSWRYAGGSLALEHVLTPSGAGASGDELRVSIPLHYLDAAAPVVDRVTGLDRFHVAEGIAEVSHPDGADTIVVASGLGFADALSAAPAAARLDAPLLLTYPWQLPTGTAQRIAALSPTTIMVVGGPVSVSPDVLAELTALAPGAEVLRLNGADRFAASRDLVRYVFGTEPAHTVYLATGRTFPDALSAGVAAGAAGEPVLLVDGLDATLDAETLELLGDLQAERVAIAGGPASVSPGIEQQLRTLLGDAVDVRLSGADRFEASHTIARAGFDTASRALIATGLAFPDAFAGAAWAAATDAPLYVVPTSCIPAAVLGDLATLQVERVTLLGGPVSLTAAVAALTPCG